MKEFFLLKKNHLIKTFKEGSGNILHFSLAFTGLFLILAAIILRASSAGMYTTTDQGMRNIAADMASLSNRATNSNVGTLQTGGDSQDQFHPQTRDFGFYVVAYDAAGNILNPGTDEMAAALSAKNMKPNQAFLNQVGSTTLYSQTYRTLIVKLKTYLSIGGGTVAYFQLFQNVSQIQDSINSTANTITLTMIIFWFLSLFVAIYLSRVAQRPLEVALERQKAFVSNASHELRTPLAIMQNRLQLLFQHPNATIIDESENISASLNEVRNMRVLTSNLLNMAKSDGSVNIQPVQTDENFFNEVFDNFKILAKERKKSFSSSVKFDGSIQLDQDLIKQVLTILFDNAAKYTDEAGAIHAEVQKQRNDLLLSVSDNGPGISSPDKKKIFDRFYRVDEARTRGKGGLGLGLSLANEIVRAMKGKITVEDNKPQGTKFVIKLKV